MLTNLLILRIEGLVLAVFSVAKLVLNLALNTSTDGCLRNYSDTNRGDWELGHMKFNETGRSVSIHTFTCTCLSPWLWNHKPIFNNKEN